MSVNYKLLKNYGKLPKSSEYRAVIVENQKVGLRRIADNIEGAMSLTSADIVGAVAGLRDEIIRNLQSGNSVHLPGIGHFSLSVKGDVYEDPRTHRYRLRNAKVRTVKFRPDKEMMGALEYTEFVNTTYKHGTSEVPTEAEIDEAIDMLLAKKPFFTVEDFRYQLNLSRTYAYRVTAKLAKAGKIHDVGTGRAKAYMRGEAWGK